MGEIEYIVVFLTPGSDVAYVVVLMAVLCKADSAF